MSLDPSSNITVNKCDFSPEGLNIGKDNRVMTYLYGLSDFWSYMFEDTSSVNLLLEANAVIASDIYSKFLQLTSSISIEDIQKLTASQIKLVFIKATDLVPGTIETYQLTDQISGSRLIANKPLLPTRILENGKDYYIDDINHTIKFAAPLLGSAFPYRITGEGIREYALWFVDVEIDDNLIYENFGKLIGVDQPEKSSENFKNFIYGMYYMYINGPTLDSIRRGLNLSLGIPLARDKEEVLEIRKYLNTDQYIVITDLNSYLIPYGLEPEVSVGDILETGSELAYWVEVKDYINDGDWWINFQIPKHILPSLPNDDPTTNRYATSGSWCDWIMRNYLRKHTFLVNVKTTGFKNIQNFQNISQIINKVKPSYTTPIYVWTIPILEDQIDLVETLNTTLNMKMCSTLTDGIYRFERDATSPLLRICPQFTRFSAKESLKEFLGKDTDINGPARIFEGEPLTGYVVPQLQIKELSEKEKAWMQVFLTRGQNYLLNEKSVMSFGRNISYNESGVTSNPLEQKFGKSEGYRMVYLYTTVDWDLKAKLASVGLPLYPEDIFTVFKPRTDFGVINGESINGVSYLNWFTTMQTNFNTLFIRDANVHYLGAMFPKDAYRTFTPLVGDLTTEDYLVVTRIMDQTYGVFWVTKNFTYQTDEVFWGHKSDDVLSVEIDGPLSRGMFSFGGAMYTIRGAETVSSVPYTDPENGVIYMSRGGNPQVSVKRTLNN